MRRVLLLAACLAVLALAFVAPVSARPPSPFHSSHPSKGLAPELVAEATKNNKASKGEFAQRQAPRPIPTLADPSGPLTETQYGWVQGYTDDGVNTYRGIPFAAPPTGENRFREPQDAKNWSTVLPVYSQQQICPQIHIFDWLYLGGEDCLYLDVYAPADAITSGEKLPVFVWIFGGAWVLGDGYEFGLYDGHNVAKARNHIIVTFNYRLGPLGFMANDAMRDETELGTAGNMGLLDQVKVLQWVQKNIANFGGDPDRVTIAGESAGAFSVCWHLASPLSAGLFHAAILESGTCDSAAFFMPYELSRNWTNTFVGMVGCNPDANSSTVMSCLRALPTGKIMGDILEAKSADVAGNVGQLRSAYEDLMASGATQWGYTPLLFPLMSWGATIDGVSLLDMPLNQIASGNYNKVPAIQGTNNDEGTIFVPAMPLIIPGIHWPTQSGDLEIAMNYIFGGNQTTVGGIISLYPQSNYASAEATFNVILRDYMFVCPARRALSAMNAAGASTWLYHWDYQGDWIDDLLFGDYHSAELEFVFANQWPPIMHMFSLNDYTMANTVDTYWNNMVWYHNPNGNESVTDSVSRRTQLKDEEFWAEYSPEQNRQNMVLAVPTRVEQDYFESQCEFWDSVDSFNRVGAEVKKFDAPAPKKHPKHAAPAKPKQHLSEKPLKKHAPTHASKPKKHHLRQH